MRKIIPIDVMALSDGDQGSVLAEGRSVGGPMEVNATVDEWPPRDEAIAMLKEGICPLCKVSPFRMPLGHLNRMHGWPRESVREHLGVSGKEVFTSPDLHLDNAERGREAGMPADVRKRSIQVRAERGRRKTEALTRASRENQARSAEMGRQRGEEFRARFLDDWDSSDKTWTHLHDCAIKYGRSAKHLREVIVNSGRAIEDGRSVSPKRNWDRPSADGCSVAKCERPHVAKGLCRFHWRKARIAEGNFRACDEPGCEAPVVARDMCGKHYARWRAMQ
nr:MAG TPA_asm: ROS/MUCR transcriptional regulator protein [Caudoviricetes sp.]